MYKTKDEVLVKSKEAIGKTFGEIDQYHRIDNKKNKGALGQIIEESLFGYQVNSRAEADFVDAGVELKVTPIKLNKNGTYSAKERLVLNIIDYHKEVLLKFDTSTFWMKNNTLLLMFYIHDFKKFKKDMMILETLLYEYPVEDLVIFKNDYKYIVDMIKAGRAHELSEADTMYLGACSKGANSSSLRTQPYSSDPAMQRAFSLKQSYMTYIVRHYVIKKEMNERIIRDIHILKNTSFEEYVYSQIRPYFGKTTESLKTILGVNSTSKSFRALLISKMLKIKNIAKSQEFIKSGMKFKTIKVEKSGSIKESMSFPQFEFTEIINETWEESTIRTMFLTTKFVFSIFRIGSDGTERFENLMFWRMPEDDLDIEYKKVFERTIETIKSGDIVKGFKYDKNHKESKITNFPNSGDNLVGHVRPHAKDSTDTFTLPVTDKKTNAKKFTKQCFWLNSTYIKNIVK